MEYYWGLDFGANRSGNTALAISDGRQIDFYQSRPKESADDWLEEMLVLFPPKIIAVDAPLSLPAGWCGGDGDLFYRGCDKELQAMSPLFLGGLTARAVKMARKLRELGINVIECYPKGFVNHLLKGVYPEVGDDFGNLMYHLPPEHQTVTINNQPVNEHQLDALICLIIAFRYAEKATMKFGKYEEGIIHL